MAYFVTLNNENIVSDVQVISDDILIGIDGKENDQNGVDFLNQLHGFHPRRIRTYKDGSKRNIFASAGYSYDIANDIFIPPKPYRVDGKEKSPLSKAAQPKYQQF